MGVGFRFDNLGGMTMARTRRTLRTITGTAAVLGTLAGAASPAAAPASGPNTEANCGRNLISHATVAKILGLPHVGRGEGCTDDAWSGKRPSAKRKAAALKNGTFAQLESFFSSAGASGVSDLLGSYEGKEIKALGGTHRAFQPSTFGAEFARGHQGKGRLPYVKATWWSPSKQKVIYVALFGGARTFAQGRAVMNKLGAVLVPAALALPPEESTSPSQGAPSR